MALQTKLKQLRVRFTKYRSSVTFVTSAICIAVFVEAFLYAVVDPIFPFSLVDRNHVAEKDVQAWVEYLFSAEAAGALISAPIFGYLSDHYANRRRPLLFGMFVLITAHVTLNFAPNLAGLMIGRFVQGISAGIIWCLGLALIADVSPEDSVGKMMGYVSAAFSVGGFGAPLIGGILYECKGYYTVFGIGYGLIFIDTILRFLIIEPEKQRKIAFEGTTFVSHHILPLPITAESSLCEEKDERQQMDLFFARNDQITPSRKSSQSSQQTLFTITSSTLTVSNEHSKTIRHPFLTLIRSRRMMVNFLVNTVVSMIISGLNVTVAVFVQEQFGWNAQGAGLIYLALASPAAFQMIYGYFVDEYGPRWPATVGILICLAPFACFGLVKGETLHDKILLVALLGLVGLGVSVTLAATMTEFTTIAVEKDRRSPGSMGKNGALAQSYSLFNISWAVGAIVGSNFAGQIHKNAGWGVMGCSYAGLCLVTLIPTILFCGGWIGRKVPGRSWYGKKSLSSSEQLV